MNAEEIENRNNAIFADRRHRMYYKDIADKYGLSIVTVRGIIRDMAYKKKKGGE